MTLSVAELETPNRMESIQVSIDKIRPYHANAKLHPPEQIEKIVRSIGLTGFDQPIVTDKDFVIIKGHGRLMAAKQMGLAEVPVVVLDIPKDVADKARLIDNKASESGYDLEILLAEIGRFEDEIFDTGYNPDEFNELLSHMERDAAIAEYDWDSLDGAEKDEESEEEGEEEEKKITLKFEIPASQKSAVLDFLCVKSTKPNLLGDALLELCGS